MPTERQRHVISPGLEYHRLAFFQSHQVLELPVRLTAASFLSPCTRVPCPTTKTSSRRDNGVPFIANRPHDQWLAEPCGYFPSGVDVKLLQTHKVPAPGEVKYSGGILGMVNEGSSPFSQVIAASQAPSMGKGAAEFLPRASVLQIFNPD